jgi:nitrogen regulation protein NR(I)
MSNILVIDDEPAILAAFEELLSGQDHQVVTLRRAEEAIERITAAPPDLVITDIKLPGIDGLAAFVQMKRLQPRMPVIVMTGQGTTASAIEATKLGAFDYLLKPVDPEEMLRVIDQALASVKLMREQVELDAGGALHSLDAIVGQSPQMQQVYKAIGRVAQTDATVLIRGESGTGKELVARAIYQHSLRSGAPLVIVNCAAIPEALLESELFGHERGAFTGAGARRIGKLEQASGGTIFLDEIGDISLSVQAKLLRVLQDKTFERLGGNEVIRADVRVIAATNRPLEQAIAEGHFREDLFHRLNVVTIRLPPLRERMSDLPKLVEYFLDRFARDLKVERPIVTPEALEVLLAHPWPGNVRELEHCLQRAIIFTHGYPIKPDDIRQALGEVQGTQPAGTWPNLDQQMQQWVGRYLHSHAGPNALAAFVESAERCMLAEAMKQTGGNQSHASRLLGIPRPTLHAKLQRYGLGRES